MKRRILMLMLAAGAVAGFASSLFGCHYHRVVERQAFEDHVAEICTRAAERSRAAVASPRPPNQP